MAAGRILRDRFSIESDSVGAHEQGRNWWCDCLVDAGGLAISPACRAKSVGAMGGLAGHKGLRDGRSSPARPHPAADTVAGHCPGHLQTACVSATHTTSAALRGLQPSHNQPATHQPLDTHHHHPRCRACPRNRYTGRVDSSSDHTNSCMLCRIYRQPALTVSKRGGPQSLQTWSI